MDELTTREAAERLGVTQQTIRNYAKRKKLHGRRIGGDGSDLRISVVSIDRFLAKHGRLDHKRRVRGNLERSSPNPGSPDNVTRERDELRGRIALLENTVALLRNAADANRMIEAEQALKIDHLLAALAADERIDDLRRRTLGELEDAIAARIVPTVPS